MCGVIVVDAGRSQSTCHGRDAYIHDHCLGYCHNYALLYQLLNSNLFTHRMFLSRERPLVKPMAPGSIFHHIIFRSVKPKTQKYFTAIYLSLLYFTLLLIFYIILYQISPLLVTVKGLTTPFSRWVQVFVCLFACVGAIIGDLCVRPTRLIPWFLTEGNTYLYFAASPFPLQWKNQRKLKK